jgi:hypothetical protein
MWASGTFDGTVARLCCINTGGIVATPSPFKHLDVLKYANCSEKLVVPVLDQVSDDIRIRVQEAIPVRRVLQCCQSCDPESNRNRKLRVSLEG